MVVEGPLSGRRLDTRAAAAERANRLLHSAAAGRGSCYVGPGNPANGRASATDSVLGDVSLLSEVFGFLLANAPPAVAKSSLCTLSGVSRLWSEHASSERYWHPVALGLFPVLSTLPPKGSFREHVRDYGRCLVHRSVTNGDSWQANLLLCFEVVDERDGARLFSSTGPVELILSSESGLTAIRLTGGRRTETNRPFSAACRDPGQNRFASIRDFFTAAPTATCPGSSVAVRVVAVDAITGKQALLYKYVSQKALVELFWKCGWSNRGVGVHVV